MQGPILLSASAFNNYAANVSDPARQQLVAGNEVEAVKQARKGALDDQAAEQKMKEEDMMLQGMQMASQIQGVKGMPQQMMHQMRGYSDVQDPAQFGMETMLPFSDESDKQRNYAGIVRSFNPQLFGASEQMVKQVAAMGPAAEKALRYRGSLYQGVPQDYATNRLYIANTRQRENSIYSFI